VCLGNFLSRKVVYDCWSDDPTIASWMANKGWSNYNQLMQYFVTATDGYVTGTAKKTVTHWNDVFDSGITVPSGSIFQVVFFGSLIGAAVCYVAKCDVCRPGTV
jgi:hypothetical protein